MSSRKLVLTQLAEDDLRAIVQYSGERLGESRSDEYADEVASVFDQLMMFPLLGRSRNDLRRGVRSLVVRDHLLLYRMTTTTIVILRIIHTQRDLRNIIGLQ